MVETEDLKEKWCRASRRGKFVRMARPSSSIDIRRFPREFRARREMFWRCEKGRV